MIVILLSLFYTEAELASLSLKESALANRHTWCLEGISYASPHEWRIWLNGQHLSPPKASAYQIQTVTANQVCFAFKKCITIGSCINAKKVKGGL